MLVYLKNIQGFRGTYQYNLDEGLNVINSKMNGVGKTTLFDCIKFLVDPSKVSKDEHKFYLNLKEDEGIFSIELNGITNGFIVQRYANTVFFRIDQNEEIERSPEPFPNVAQEVGILYINDTMLNIFSKEVNLFSKSVSRQDYKIVEAITTHKQTQDILQNINNSIELVKLENSQRQIEKLQIDNFLKTNFYYSMEKELREMLNDDSYETTEIYLDELTEASKFIKPVDKLDFNSGIEKVILLDELAQGLSVVPEHVPDAMTLIQLQDLSIMAQDLVPTETIAISTVTIETMIKVLASIEQFKPIQSIPDVSSSNLLYVENLLKGVSQLKPVEDLELSEKLITRLSSICITSAKLKTSLAHIEHTEKQLSKLRAQTLEFKIDCPIRKEVYLVDGICKY